MGRKPKISPDLRAAALADLLAGEQPAVVAKKHGLDPATVRSWKARFVAGDDATPLVTDATPVAAPRRPALEAEKAYIGETILDLLRAKLKASEAIASAVTDPHWIRRQSASELATLGQWLDSTAFAIGDRLAGAGQSDE